MKQEHLGSADSKEPDSTEDRSSWAPPQVLGIVGGVSSGKSTVAGYFQDLGARVVDADLLCHEALKDPKIQERVVHQFGLEVLGPDGVIDRTRLKGVFQAPEDLKRLESILHPVVISRILELLEEAHRDAISLLILDAPLLLETGLDSLCNAIIFVETAESTRRERASSRGISGEDWKRRENIQKRIHQKKAQADYIIDNQTSPANAREQVLRLWKLFLAARG